MYSFLGIIFSEKLAQNWLLSVLVTEKFMKKNHINFPHQYIIPSLKIVQLPKLLQVQLIEMFFCQTNNVLFKFL